MITISAVGINAMQEARNWRELLGEIISDSRERQRLIEELHVTAITLSRWVNGESEPRPYNLRRLLSILPQQREQMLKLIRAEKGGDEIPEPGPEEVSGEIPSEFYARVFASRAKTAENLRYWSTCNLILQQAIGQLDTERAGMSIWVVRCMPPSGPEHKVRSLRESMGLGTPPWSGNLEQQGMFLGAESLAGHVATFWRPGIIENLDEEQTIMPFTRTAFEKSVAIYPILYAGCVAGVLLVCSAERDHFVYQARTALLQSYADLIALAFEPEDFYPPEQIGLCVMPSQDEQEEYFAHFRELVANTMINAANKNQPTNNLLADQAVWQRLEDELIQLPTRKRERQLLP
jgi:hypothetical protein